MSSQWLQVASPVTVNSGGIRADEYRSG